ncbi:hypothetical protein B0H16DRAFT_1704451 [Mycena metata]|uniref:Uncharacterized protein n=1 Tax=Mycena metata TaxID=1033252 RepID=A0AAD7GUV4_9AGAR|nr:hypothetical protein B0H16DRAFT_1704451 [Mycena metata]
MRVASFLPQLNASAVGGRPVGKANLRWRWWSRGTWRGVIPAPSGVWYLPLPSNFSRLPSFSTSLLHSSPVFLNISTSPARTAEAKLDIGKGADSAGRAVEARKVRNVHRPRGTDRQTRGSQGYMASTQSLNTNGPRVQVTDAEMNRRMNEDTADIARLLNTAGKFHGETLVARKHLRRLNSTKKCQVSMFGVVNYHFELRETE